MRMQRPVASRLKSWEEIDNCQHTEPVVPTEIQKIDKSKKMKRTNKVAIQRRLLTTRVNFSVTIVYSDRNL